MNQRDESTIVEVDGKSLRLTHLSKVMFPEDGFTKAELLLYYQTIAPLLLPHLPGRPLTLKAFPNVVKERPYYRRRLASTAPPWLSRVPPQVSSDELVAVFEMEGGTFTLYNDGIGGWKFHL